MNSQCKKLQCPLITMGFSKFAHTAKVLLHMWPGRHWWLLVVWGAWDPRRFPQSLFLFPRNTLFSFRDPWWVTRAVWSVRGWRCPWCLESVIREYLLWFHLSIFLSLSLSLLLSSSLPPHGFLDGPVWRSESGHFLTRIGRLAPPSLSYGLWWFDDGSEIWSHVPSPPHTTLIIWW